MCAGTEGGLSGSFEKCRSNDKPPLNLKNHECDGCCNGDDRAGSKRNHDQGGFDVVTGLKRVVPVVRQFGNMTSQANGNGSDRDELENALTQA